MVSIFPSSPSWIRAVIFSETSQRFHQIKFQEFSLVLRRSIAKRSSKKNLPRIWGIFTDFQNIFLPRLFFFSNCLPQFLFEVLGEFDRKFLKDFFSYSRNGFNLWWLNKFHIRGLIGNFKRYLESFPNKKSVNP